MTSGIYEIRNTTNGKCYVGSSINMEKRWKEHRSLLRNRKHHAMVLQRAWHKYGESAFVFRKLFVCEDKLLVFYEQRALDVIRPAYNATTCAASPSIDPIIREKIRKSLVGHVLSEGTKAKISAANKGRKQSAEAIAARVAGHEGRSIEDKKISGLKISASLKRRYEDPVKREHLRTVNIGRIASEATRQKMSAYASNRTAEHNAKLSAAASARYAKLRKATTND